MEIYIVMLVIVLCSAILGRILHARSVGNSQAAGLANIVKIKRLISLVQQHRGMSSAWLNGDLSKRSNLQNIEQQITKLCTEINKTNIGKLNPRWIGFLDHWSRLNRKVEDRDIGNNFKQHTQMIENLLYLLEDEAERAQLNSTSLPELPNIGYVWRELVLTAESVGQSRAIGTGVATAKQCTSVDKIRLSFLEKHIKLTSHEILTKLSNLEQYSTQHGKLLKAAQSKMQQLIETIESELIQASPITMDQNSYFDLASDTIQSLDNIFDSQIDQVKIALNR